MTLKIKSDSINLLKKMICIPSFSKEESETGDLLESFFHEINVPTHRLYNNIWAFNKFYDSSKPTILLNSHHDTVKPNCGYTRDPFAPTEEDGRLYGLGSNDAGASVVSLIAVFRHFYDMPNLRYNLCVAITGEEEISGKNGVESILPLLGDIELGVVGEPTCMQMAIAERGLMVVDCVVQGTGGHAAREEGDNAIYKALKDIEWFKNYEFEKVSDLFGKMKMNVTVINAGTAHNVIPATCNFTVDIRITECYTHEEVIDIIKKHVSCQVVPRSLRLRPSSIPTTHPLVESGVSIGLNCYGSPTTSDQSLMDFPTLKIGVGDSARSHSADEFVYLHEITEGIDTYIKLLEHIL